MKVSSKKHIAAIKMAICLLVAGFVIMGGTAATAQAVEHNFTYVAANVNVSADNVDDKADQILLYGTKSDATASSYNKVPARSVPVFEYAVTKYDDSTHRITKVSTEGQIDVPYRGYAISSPNDLEWNIGDTVSLDDVSGLAFYDNSIYLAAINVRLPLTTVDNAYAANSFQLYTSAFGKHMGAGSRVRLVCKFDSDGIARITNYTDGESSNNVPIPQNGFIITAHGSANGLSFRTLCQQYASVVNKGVGTEVVWDVWSAAANDPTSVQYRADSDTILTEIQAGGISWPFAEKAAAVRVSANTDLNTLVGSIGVNRAQTRAAIQVIAPSELTLPMTVQVNVTSANGLNVDTYQINVVESMTATVAGKGTIEIEGINNIVDMGDKTLLFGTKSDYMVVPFNGLTANAYANVPERADKDVYEYAVTIINDDLHLVTGISTAGGMAIPARGYTISAVNDLGWENGDKVTLSDSSPLAYYDNSIYLDAINFRLPLIAVNETYAINRTQLYTPAYGSNVAAGTYSRLVAANNENGVAEISAYVDGFHSGIAVPANGYILISQGASSSIDFRAVTQRYCTIPEQGVGTEIRWETWDAGESDASLVSITVDGNEQPFVDNNVDIKVSKDTDFPAFVTGLADIITKSNPGATINVVAPQNYILPMVVTLEVTSQNGYVTDIYTINVEGYVTATVNGSATDITDFNNATDMGNKTLVFGTLSDGTANSYNKVPARTGSVYEYAVIVLSADRHIVAEVSQAGQITVPYHGYAISARDNLGWAVGDEVTLSDSSMLAFYDNSIYFEALNIRLPLTTVDAAYAGNSFQIYTPAFAATLGDAYRTRILVEYDQNGVAVITEFKDGGTASSGAIAVPANGFILTANGIYNGINVRELTKGFNNVANKGVGTAVAWDNWLADADTGLKSIQAAQKNYSLVSSDEIIDIKVADSIDLEQMFDQMTVNVNTEGAQVTVIPPAAFSLPMTAQISVTSKNGYFTKTYTLNFKVDTAENAMLSEIKIDGAALADFAATNKTIGYRYAKGSALPVVDAAPFDQNAALVITQATAENPQAVITVTAEDTSFVSVYTINFYEVDNTLVSITVNGHLIEDFDALTHDYTFTHRWNTAPRVAAAASDKDTRITYIQSNTTDGKATITVTNGEFVREYTVTFTADTEPAGTSALSAVVYAALTLVIAASVGFVVMTIVKRKRG